MLQASPPHTIADGQIGQLWRAPRVRSLLALGVVVALATLASVLAHGYTDLLWFRELGHEPIYWTTLRWKLLGRAVPAFGTACFVIVNLAVAERTITRQAAHRPQRRIAYAAVAVIAGLVTAHWRAAGMWRLLALWSGRTDFGTRDPVFHRDVGFYVFSLPLQQQLVHWLLESLAMATVAVVAAYAAAGLLRSARAHLLTLAALAFALLAWRFRLDQFALALPHRGSAVPGASYTDVHVRVPARRALTLLALAAAGLCLYARRRPAPRKTALIVAVAGVLALLAQSGLPSAIQHFDVQPQELTRERPYVAGAIASTRHAYGLDAVRVRRLRSDESPSPSDLAAARTAIANVPLWDSDVLRPALDEQQSIGRYYSFPRTTVDAYDVDGHTRLLTVAARQLDRRRLSRSWATQRFAYTHGYGAVAMRSGGVDDAGHPRLGEADFQPSRGSLGLREPRVYFDDARASAPPYIVVHTKSAEVDRPEPGSRAPAYHYSGSAGIPLSSPLRRAAFAVRFVDLKLLLTESVTPDSRIVLRRNVHDRVTELAPFVRWDTHPQTVIADGRIQYLLHGYTTSSSYPYSKPMRMWGHDINYLRASATATVDAFTGSVRLYAADEPILRAWRSVYPGLFQDETTMPSELRAHVRYPRALFQAQARVYATYHADDPTGFWNGADAWQLPLQLAGPVEGAGEVHFPDPEQRIDSDQADDPSDRLRMRPAYLLARLPGDTREQLILASPYTPRGRENLTGFLAGTIDAAGGPQLTLLTTAFDRVSLGPTQATRRILANPRVSQRLELLNRESRDLGRAAVNRTILGAPRAVPIGDTLVHVQPIYVVAGGSGVPQLQLVTVCVAGRVGFGPDVATALRRAVDERE
jgi:uncharacterized membrane protein (UPF0182 family)